MISPAICVVLYGNVDAQIRPNRAGKVFPRIPKRFQGGGMLMPRPFYSHDFFKRVGQLADNAARKFFAMLIKSVDGTEQWVPLPSFKLRYDQLLDGLARSGLTAVACSCVYIDERLFPGTPHEYIAFNESIRECAEAHGAPYVDMWSTFKMAVEAQGWDSVYNKDHFHPNGKGYVLMAQRIANVITRLEE